MLELGPYARQLNNLAKNALFTPKIKWSEGVHMIEEECLNFLEIKMACQVINK